MMVGIILGLTVLFLFGCQTTKYAGGAAEGADLPPPAGSEQAISGQGFSTGTYDRVYQLFNNFYPDGSVTSYLVDNGQWVYLGRLAPWSISLAAASSPQPGLTRGDLTLHLVPGFGYYPSHTGVGLVVNSTTCSDHIIKVNSSGTYQTLSIIPSIPDTVISSERFNIPLNGRRPLSQIVGTGFNYGTGREQFVETGDALTVHFASRQVSWFTVHCDRATVPVAACDESFTLQQGETHDLAGSGSLGLTSVTNAGGINSATLCFNR